MVGAGGVAGVMRSAGGAAGAGRVAGIGGAAAGFGVSTAARFAARFALAFSNAAIWASDLARAGRGHSQSDARINNVISHKYTSRPRAARG